MRFRVQVSNEAQRDLQRLSAFQAGRSEALAKRAMATLQTAVSNLSEMPNRGRPGPVPLRELIVPFGSGSYVVQYRVTDQVVVARIFHSLEDRPLA